MHEMKHLAKCRRPRAWISTPLSRVPVPLWPAVAILLLMILTGLSAVPAHAALALWHSPRLAAALPQQHSGPPQDSSGAKTSPAQPAPADNEQQFSDLEDAVAHDVLEPLRNGIQVHSLKQITAVLDPQSMPDYAQVRDQFHAMLATYSVLKFRYKILQISSQDGGASVTCEFDLDATPADDNLLPVRRTAQMRLQLKPTSKGWKIVSFSPANFFANES